MTTKWISGIILGENTPIDIPLTLILTALMKNFSASSSEG
jgi:hypothetical protein